MTTEWTDLPTLQDIAAAQARGDEIWFFNMSMGDLEPWNGEIWFACGEYRSRPKQKTPEERIAELEGKLMVAREALVLALKEFNGLPRSLGYDITHAPKIEAALAAIGDKEASK